MKSIALAILLLTSQHALADQVKAIEKYVINWSSKSIPIDYKVLIKHISHKNYLTAFINLLDHDNKEVRSRAAYYLFEQFTDGRTDGVTHKGDIYLLELHLIKILKALDVSETKGFMVALLGAREVDNSYEYIPCFMSEENRKIIINTLNATRKKMMENRSVSKYSIKNIDKAIKNSKSCI